MQYLGNGFFGIWEKIFSGRRKTAKRERISSNNDMFRQKSRRICQCAPLRGVFLLDIFAGLQHIFREDGKSLGRIIDKHMGNRADESAVLQDRRAAHGCVK